MAVNQSPGEGWAWYGDAQQKKGRWGIDAGSSVWDKKLDLGTGEDEGSWGDYFKKDSEHFSKDYWSDQSDEAKVMRSLPGWFGFTSYNPETGAVRGYSRHSGGSGVITQGGDLTAEHYGQPGSWSVDWDKRPDGSDRNVVGDYWWEQRPGNKFTAEQHAAGYAKDRPYFSTDPFYQDQVTQQKGEMRQKLVDKAQSGEFHDLRALHAWDQQYGQEDMAAGKHFTQDSAEDMRQQQQQEKALEKFSRAGGIVRDVERKAVEGGRKLMQIGSDFRDWRGLDGKGLTMGEKVQAIADFPSNVSTAGQAFVPLARSMLHTAGLTQGTDANPMKIGLSRADSDRRRDAANQYINTLSPDALAEIQKTGRLSGDQLTAFNKAINTGRQGATEGTTRNEFDPWRLTMNNLANSRIDIEPDPINKGQYRVNRVYDNYQYDRDTDVSFGGAPMRGLVKAFQNQNIKNDPLAAKYTEDLTPSNLEKWTHPVSGEELDVYKENNRNTRRLPTYLQFNYDDQRGLNRSQRREKMIGGGYRKSSQPKIRQLINLNF